MMPLNAQWFLAQLMGNAQVDTTLNVYTQVVDAHARGLLGRDHHAGAA